MTVPAGRLLLVGDTSTRAEVAKAPLRNLNHTVRLVETAAAALDQTRAWDPDTILLEQIAGGRERPDA